MDEVTYPEDFSDFIIGKKYHLLNAENSKTNSAAALSLISQARRRIDLFTHNLEPLILDTPEIAAAITNFVKISPNSRLRILLCDPAIAVKKGHRLIELSRKFSSFISIRNTNKEYQSRALSLLMVDHKATLFRPHANEYHAIVNYQAGYECRQHLEFFNEVWNRSEPASELRQLFA